MGIECSIPLLVAFALYGSPPWQTPGIDCCSDGGWNRTKQICQVVLPSCFNSSYPSQCYFTVSRQWILWFCHLSFFFFSRGAVSVEVHILAIHFLKNISAKSITRRSLGTGKCLQRLNCVDRRCGQAPFLQIKSEPVLLSGVTRGKAGISDKKRKPWVIWLCYDHFNQWFSGTSCIFLQCTLPVL